MDCMLDARERDSRKWEMREVVNHVIVNRDPVLPLGWTTAVLVSVPYT